MRKLLSDVFFKVVNASEVSKTCAMLLENCCLDTFYYSGSDSPNIRLVHADRDAFGVQYQDGASQ